LNAIFSYPDITDHSGTSISHTCHIDTQNWQLVAGINFLSNERRKILQRNYHIRSNFRRRFFNDKARHGHDPFQAS
jgi:hypothetical protein